MNHEPIPDRAGAATSEPAIRPSSSGARRRRPSPAGPPTGRSPEWGSVIRASIGAWRIRPGRRRGPPRRPAAVPSTALRTAARAFGPAGPAGLAGVSAGVKLLAGGGPTSRDSSGVAILAVTNGPLAANAPRPMGARRSRPVPSVRRPGVFPGAGVCSRRDATGRSPSADHDLSHNCPCSLLLA